jgi:two-component system phosphate regulon response regulator PhoB
VSGTILVVDDEVDLVDSVQYSLQREGFEIRTAHSGGAALIEARRRPVPDLILLDLMLPDRSGLDVCRELKRDPATSAVPVVMLTARGSEVDRVVGFELGADDYVVKPFSVRELVLRIKAVLRRGPSAPEAVGPVEVGRLRLDEVAHRVWVDDEQIELTALEFRLLATFVHRRGRVQTREVLLNDVWEMRGDLPTRTVDTHVKRLRKRLGAAGEYIETLRGVGYRFSAEP